MNKQLLILFASLALVGCVDLPGSDSGPVLRYDLQPAATDCSDGDTPLSLSVVKVGAGINHKAYGVTSEGVNVFLDVALRSLGIDPSQQPFTLKLTGGPAGDVALEEEARFPVFGLEGVEGGLVAPMPGNVLSTHVEAGDAVEAGQLLLVLEAMKMEHRVTAPEAGTVAEIRVAAGDQVGNGELLVLLETDGD